MSTQQLTPEQVLTKMKEAMGGQIPRTMELAGEVMPDMVVRQTMDRAFAMPPESGALTEETRTLIYLAVALATGSKPCIESMSRKSKKMGIAPEKLLETFKIARFAESSRVLGNAEFLFESIQNNP